MEESSWLTPVKEGEDRNNINGRLGKANYFGRKVILISYKLYLKWCRTSKWRLGSELWGADGKSDVMKNLGVITIFWTCGSLISVMGSLVPAPVFKRKTTGNLEIAREEPSEDRPVWIIEWQPHQYVLEGRGTAAEWLLQAPLYMLMLLMGLSWWEFRS